MTIIDRRKSGKNKSVTNRQKFIKRYKNRIKRSIDEITSDKGITDVMKDRKVTIDEDELDEPSFDFDLSTGKRSVVVNGNKTLGKGDKVYQPPEGDGDGGTEGSPDGEGFDEFSFTLTKEEFLDLYFSDMELPDFIKESMKGSDKYKFKRAGYTKDGIPARLDLLKTLKQAMARRIATGSKRYLDDVDMRYKHFTKQPYPIRKATMILLMDVSASMREKEKMISKKFFLLLYLFLHKVYTSVEVLFVIHTQNAKEVTEEEFFYGKETGGTVVSSGLELVNNIIDERMNLSEENVYIAQASDGDIWSGDLHTCGPLMDKLLQKVQYFAYLQVEPEHHVEYKREFGVKDLMYIYKQIDNQKLQCKHAADESEVYPVLRELFER